MVPFRTRGPGPDNSGPGPETITSDDSSLSNGFWLPDGTSTFPCHLQNTKPVFFKSNDQFSTSYFVQLHKLVSAQNTYNYCGARIPLAHNKLNVDVWRKHLVEYHDSELCEYLEFGWPLGIDPSYPLKSTLKNHSSSFQFAAEMDNFIGKQLSSAALSGPCVLNPFDSDVTISPMMTVPKKPNGRRIVIDASFGNGPNAATPKGEFLGDTYI